MKWAADLLTDRNLLVKDIAKQVGMADPFHFSRIFKKVLGLSPKEFQRHLVTSFENQSMIAPK